jgi:hypothetical protein
VAIEEVEETHIASVLEKKRVNIKPVPIFVDMKSS